MADDDMPITGAELEALYACSPDDTPPPDTS